jgi:hypothetical protein
MIMSYEIITRFEAQMQNIKRMLDDFDKTKRWMNDIQKVERDGRIVWACNSCA